MFVGTVKLYKNLWKFGFIVKDGGDQVFEIDESLRGPRAVNIRKV